MLKRADIDAQADEPTAATTAILVGAVGVKVTRFPNQSRVTIEFLGFDGSIIPWNLARQDRDLTAASVEEIGQAVRQFVDGVGTLLKRDQAVKQGR